MNLSVCLEKEGQREKAIHILNMIKQKPSFKTQQSKLYNNIGVMHHKNGNLAVAKDFIEKALLQEEQPASRPGPAANASIPESALQQLSQEFTIHFNLAIVAMQKAALEEALEHFENATIILNRFEDDEHKIVGISVKTHRLNISVNKALLYQAMKQPQQALKFATLALKLAPTNEKVLGLKTQMEVELKQQSNSQRPASKGSLQKIKIIENHPNAESLSNQHSRKSSVAGKETHTGRSGRAVGEPGRPLDTEELGVGARHDGADGENQMEDDALHKMDIQVELQPIELTKEEEQNNADSKMEKIREGTKAKKQIDSTQLVSRRDMQQEPASNHRDPSPDILLGGAAAQAAAQSAQTNTAWKQWTQEQCQEVIASLQGKETTDE